MPTLLTQTVPLGKQITGQDWRTLPVDLARLQNQTAVARACTVQSGGSLTLGHHDSHIAVTAVPCTLTLPEATTIGDGRELTVKDESGSCSGASPITVQRSGAETIDGATSFQLQYAYAALRLISRGGNWWRLDNNDL